jgi:hypothetical protein
VLAAPVALHDVKDVEAFVRATIRRSGIQLGLEEREELVAEGICILFELARRYVPKPPAGRFSGYAAQFLPRRLGDAWHASHPEHRYVTTTTGKRTWHYEPSPISFDGLTGGELERAELTARGIGDWVRVSAPPIT